MVAEGKNRIREESWSGLIYLTDARDYPIFPLFWKYEDIIRG
jgi:hypothetical protein